MAFGPHKLYSTKKAGAAITWSAQWWLHHWGSGLL